MPLSKDHKARTRERIIAAAARLFRRDGVDGVSVPGLMKEAGLTQGGFYAHFASKDALVAEAVARGLRDTTERMVGVAERSGDPIGAMIDDYLSPGHRDQPEAGCIVSALGAEASRGAPVIREAMTDGIREAARRLKEKLGLEGDGEDEAIALFAGMIGALVLARATRTDPAFSDRVLKVSAERLKRSFK
ncbi:TetR/AcrR family transcriptional regulator [Azorhizobium doebereinerae]|uniref:TetR/AcrR family transcriptional regulator n=1 Tax=Azorhizobium doebereinerae TaxID=281091 RepID=UPI00048BCF89|nr:TetR/AcrR family transcriptional regulator [Azorhizobium doebereinerae]